MTASTPAMPRPSSEARHRAPRGDVRAALLVAHDDALMLDMVSDARRLAALARCNSADGARHARSQAASIERYGQRVLNLAESVRAIAARAEGGRVMSCTGFFVIAFYPDGYPYVSGPYETPEHRRRIAGLIKGGGHNVIEVDTTYSATRELSLRVGNPGYIEPIKEDEDG